MTFFLAEYPGVWTLPHILYLITWAIIFGVTYPFIIKKARDERVLKIIIKSIAALLLVMILVNRFSITIVYVKNGGSWIYLLPYTFCGLTSLVLSITLLIGKKDNIILHAVCYSALIGGLITTMYPDFLASQTF